MLQNWGHIQLQLNKNKIKKNTSYELHTFITTAENDGQIFTIEIGALVSKTQEAKMIHTFRHLAINCQSNNT